MVQIKGNRGRAVPVLLTRDVKQAIEVLQKQREACGVLAENPYIFARPRNSMRPLRGWDCLQAVARRANFKEPEAITSTKLWKYVATVSQIIDLSSNELDWLARHLGHDINVHHDFYRKHESTLELAKVSKLLVAVDQGQLSNLTGQKLDDVTLDGMYTWCDRYKTVHVKNFSWHPE